MLDILAYITKINNVGFENKLSYHTKERASFCVR